MMSDYKDYDRIWNRPQLVKRIFELEAHLAEAQKDSERLVAFIDELKASPESSHVDHSTLNVILAHIKNMKGDGR